VGTWLRAVVPS